MVVLHLLASPFFGGPERQVLGVAHAMPSDYRSVIASFAEGGRADAFLDQSRQAGFETIRLRSNWPNVFRVTQELAELSDRVEADLLVTHGYKPDILGLAAARRIGIPVVGVAHGWTSATWKVRLNEWLDKRALARCDRVIGVSEKQSERCRESGVAVDRLVTIPNGCAIGAEPRRDDVLRSELLARFPTRPQTLVIAAGRLSPEKGFDVLIDAADQLKRSGDSCGVLIFGEGPRRADLEHRIRSRGVGDRVVLGGFREDLDRLLSQADLFVLSSHTEGLPVALLEAMGAGVAVVATAVGGVPEVVTDREHGLLAPPGDSASLAAAIEQLLTQPDQRQRLAAAGRERVVREFTHTKQAARYAAVFDDVVRIGSRSRARR